MIYGSRVLTMTFVIMAVYACWWNTYAGIFGDEMYIRGANVHLVTTYTPQYFARREGRSGHGRVGRFFFGEKARETQGDECAVMDGSLCSYIKRRKMDDAEYKKFTDMTFFFENKNNLLYKIVMEQRFSRESLAKDRMKTIREIAEDCNKGFEMSLERIYSDGDRIIYRCFDDEFEIELELSMMGDGGLRRLSLTITNTKVRDGRSSDSFHTLPTFNADTDIDVSI